MKIELDLTDDQANELCEIIGEAAEAFRPSAVALWKAIAEAKKQEHARLMREHVKAPADFYGTEHETGLDGLYCCCDSRTETPPAGYGLRYVKTQHPATSPEVGTPAFAAWSAGADVWEPVLILRRAAK